MTSCSPRPRSPGSGSSWLCLRTRLSQAAAAQPCTRRTVRPVGPRPAPGPATGRARNNGAMTCGQPCRSRPRSQCIRQYLFANGRSPGGLPSAGFSCRTRNGPGSCSRRTRSEPAGCGRWRCALCTAMVCTTSGGRHRAHVRQAAAMGQSTRWMRGGRRTGLWGGFSPPSCPRARYALARTLPSRPEIDHSRSSDSSIDGGHPIVEQVELVTRRCASDGTGCGGVVPLGATVGDRWERCCAHLPGATPLGLTRGARWPAQSRDGGY